MSLAAIVLCAGNGTRMKSNLPKVLHEIGSFPLIHHVMTTTCKLDVSKTIVVVGHQAEEVSKAAISFDKNVVIVEQKKQLGTGHAVQEAMPELLEHTGNVIILYGDVPFIGSSTIKKMIEKKNIGSDIVIAGFKAQHPGAYGRIVLENEKIIKIIEAKDATKDELANNLCNSGIILSNSRNLHELTKLLKNENAKEEFYLTDIIEIANNQGQICSLVLCPEMETLGVNTRLELSKAETLFQKATRENCMNNGVTLASPENTIFSLDTHIGRDTWIGHNVVFGPGVTIESEATIKSFCHLEKCHVGSRAKIGPFTRLRPGTEIGNSSQVGNFVEIKNSSVGEDSKINHLSYVGDTNIGNTVNIGAGTITCNYDGVNKHKTVIESGTFIGSNSSLIAPLNIGSDVIIGAGSVITENVPKNSLGIARARQENKIGLGQKIMRKLHGLRYSSTGK